MLKHLPVISTAAWLVVASVLPMAAQSREEQAPKELQEVGVTEHPGAQIDLNLEFIAEDGYPKPLKTYFQGGRPVILNLVYYTCPMLCNLVLNGQVEALRQIPWTPGKEFEVVSVSIDPTENFQIARNKKTSYLTSYEKPDAGDGWHFLVDHQGNVKKLAEQVGFKYKFDPRIGQYAHTAAIFVITPEGKISRYLYGVKFKPLDLRLAMVDAAKEHFSASVDRVLLFCYHYDPQTHSYTLFATNLMRAGGVAALLILSLVLFRFWRRERLVAASRKGLVNAK